MLRIKQEGASARVSNKTVPLKQVRIDAKLRSFAADVTLIQVFQNDDSVAVEAVYCFPVEENAAIYAFVARIDNEREIIAELKEKKVAQQEYTEALAEGHGAYLLEQDEASNDIFIVSVGALQPGSQCHITISYVSELDLLYSSKKPTIRFVIPTTIAPRYSPTHKTVTLPGGTHAEYAQSVPYTIEFTCKVEKLDQSVASISSPSHPIKIDISNEEIFLVTFTQEDTALDRDIIIDVELSEVRKNTIVAIDNSAVMISFIPTEQDCQRNSDNGINEFIFVIDCSGSMGSEDKIGLARKAMLLFIKSLPINCRFNIIRFGSNFAALFNDQVTREYNETNMRQAEAMIKTMNADLGGTELLAPLNWLKKNKPSTGCARQIFLLTDGEVSNVDEVTNLCQEMATHTRIFSFGLGHSPSRALVKGLARATNGYFVFIAPGTNVDVYVAEQLTRALQPSIVDVYVKWNTSQRILHNVPERAPPVFVGARLLFYALLDETMPFDHSTTVELFTGTQQQSIGVASIDHVPPVLNSQTIMRLAGKALLRELLNAQKPMDRESLVNLSIKYGILCPHTAFIGVEKRLNANSESNANMELREVPIMIDKSMIPLVDLQYSINQLLSRSSGCIDSIPCYGVQLCSASSKSFYKSASRKTTFSASIGSIMQPVAGFISSLFTTEKSRKKLICTDSDPVTHATCDNTSQTLCNSNSSNSQTTEVIWPTDEQKLVDRFIELQQYDGLWMLTADDVKQLTGKSLTVFSSLIVENMKNDLRQLIITTAIVIIILEARCSSLKTLWQALSNKAHKRLNELLGGNEIQLEQLMKDIRDHFQ